MKILIAGAMLCALSLPALAHDPHTPLPGIHCVPYGQAVGQIEDAGGRILGELPAPFTRHGTTLYFVSKRLLLSAGVAAAKACVYLPAAVVGPLAFDPQEL